MKESLQPLIDPQDRETQNRRLIEYLSTGNTIHCMHPAKNRLEIGYLNSRISDIRKKLRQQGKDVFKRRICVTNYAGKWKRVVEYSFYPFN